jgi:poly-gamma-glutamate synthesis protein (capsule biosynthesis protein)
VKDNGVCSFLAMGDFCPVSPDPTSTTGSMLRTGTWVGKGLARVITDADVAMVNLEGPIAGAGSRVPKAGAALSIDSAACDALGSQGINVVCLANNHIMDYGWEGLRHTLALCEAKGLRTCGAGEDRDAALQPLHLTESSGMRVAVMAVCEHEFGRAGPASPGTGWVSDPGLCTLIREVKQITDVVIVAAHGGCEEVPFPSPQRRAQLRRLVDAGADLVIGHHAHVPQGWEKWGSGLIIFSLGDFYFRWQDGSHDPTRRWSIATLAHFGAGRLQGVEIIPLERQPNEGVDVLDSESVAQKRLTYLGELAKIAGGDDLLSFWQVTARYLWNERYRPYMERIAGNHFCRNRFQSLKRTISGTLDRLRVRLTGYSKPDRRDPTPDSQELLLLTLLRTESHRWAMETWLSLATGDAECESDTEIEQEFERFMAMMRTL